MKKHEIILKRSKETKGTWVYEEESPEGSPPILKTQYLQKWALGNPPPEKIKITIEEVK